MKTKYCPKCGSEKLEAQSSGVYKCESCGYIGADDVEDEAEEE